MFARLIWVIPVFSVFAMLGGCASNGNYVPTNLSKDELKLIGSGKLVKLQNVLPENAKDKLVLSASAYPNGVIVCAIENLSRPCLPKLSALVASRLAQKGILIAQDASKADAMVYFETWFDTFSSHSSMVKGLSTNPAAMGNDFAAKMEQSLVSGQDPDVHKRFRFALDPFQLIGINSNDEQKFVYVALSAVPLKDSVTYSGSGADHKGASNNPWVKEGAQPGTRILLGNFDGEIETAKAATPMFNDALELLAQRVLHEPVVK